MAVAISIFVILSVADQGLIYVVKSLLYPIFVSGVIVLWCSIGQMVNDEVSELLKSGNYVDLIFSLYLVQ